MKNILKLYYSKIPEDKQIALSIMNRKEVDLMANMADYMGNRSSAQGEKNKTLKEFNKKYPNYSMKNGNNYTMDIYRDFCLLCKNKLGDTTFSTRKFNKILRSWL